MSKSNLFVSEADRQQILFMQNNHTKVKYPKNKMIYQLFEEQVAVAPDAIAAIYKDQTIMYQELNRKANQLARHIRSYGVGPDQIVAIMLERSLEMIIGILAIIKAGGAYLPITPSNPEKRIRYMLEDSGCRLMLTKREVMHSYDIPTMFLDDENYYTGDPDNLSFINEPNDLVYVIYTSGSTGKPKGVMIEHHSLVNRLHWMQHAYPLDANDVIMQKTPFGFDVSVWEMFWWSMVGAKVCFLLPNFERFPQAIVETAEKNQITVMHFVPSMMNAFLNYLQDAGEEEIRRLRCLKQVFVSGEALTPIHVKKFNQILHETIGTKLTNLYGPTEATIDVTYYDCPPSEEIKRVPIGKPIHNTNMYIIEEDQLQLSGESGELCIGGVGLARGYLNNPTLTAEKFVENPFIPGEKMYKTGDLARLLPDGNIEYLGRLDHQVKIRGLRIELGEIEATITDFEAIDQCIVTVNEQSETIVHLVAYVVPKKEFSVSDLKRFVKERLPEYMVPSIYMTLDSLPLTSNGKIDRKSLPDLQS
ncbi:non-ribosomal peptide synthetase [Brevibacillus laterosporus]|uniref:Amino acid adenylation domain-containing protein n=1 Tax=Brevibacillus laterosporus TaxID=1465 RepID=A0AAP3DMB2_BRELA|nr:amino acid adenylation domain-containing protein [Brevibacillus laterosporus]MCR8982789.1 amino acid adenylation domain-containing protein [Brevibacillus laterosporus]MCZ0809945.1 amino acid adenylation domain-containing protein [Brevibacillus laterosporus]MCZ0828571.1 amino acid adenylation domain-containing protein [Brevibacillus laterosporus]MCZ0852629.1 amino acid adenylation domain-containing protein [Brevibacillus laterosporus]